MRSKKFVFLSISLMDRSLMLKNFILFLGGGNFHPKKFKKFTPRKTSFFRSFRSFSFQNLQPAGQVREPAWNPEPDNAGSGFRVSCICFWALSKWRREGDWSAWDAGGIAEEERSDGARAVCVHATARRGAAHEWEGQFLWRCCGVWATQEH